MADTATDRNVDRLIKAYETMADAQGQEREALNNTLEQAAKNLQETMQATTATMETLQDFLESMDTITARIVTSTQALQNLVVQLTKVLQRLGVSNVANRSAKDQNQGSGSQGSGGVEITR